jgi:hypothetical protein
LNIVSTALFYFLPINLQSGMGFSLDIAMLLSSQSYYYTVILVLLSSYLGDECRTRGWVPCTSALCYEG